MFSNLAVKLPSKWPKIEFVKNKNAALESSKTASYQRFKRYREDRIWTCDPYVPNVEL